MQIVHYGLIAFAGLLALASVLPLSKIPFGAIRGLAFPRLQFFGLSATLALAAWAMMDGAALISMLALCAIILCVNAVYIVKFTPFWFLQSLRADDALAENADRCVRVLASNVKKSNRNYAGLTDLVDEVSPDIVMAIEVDDDWIAALRDALSDTYEHWIEQPLDNGYGMCVMSRLPLNDIDLRELVTEGVPSIRARVTLPCGRDFRLYVVHPEPPIVMHDTKGRDSEIAMIGLEAAEDALPAIVAGDLNDVAWSTTTRRFQRLSQLLDPRVGRGFYNTFSATNPLIRWPLDHLFHDAQFRFKSMKRLRHIGSDHFPILFEVVLTERNGAGIEPGTGGAGEKAEVKEMISEEKGRDRKAIGSDWEDEEDGAKADN